MEFLRIWMVLVKYYCSVLQPFSIRGLATPWTHFLHLGLGAYLCPLPFWLTLSWWVLSTSWCCPSKLCAHRLPRMRAPGIAPCIISFSMQLTCLFSWCDHCMLASLRWQSLIVPSLLQLCWWPTYLLSSLSTKLAVSSSVFSSQRCWAFCHFFLTPFFLNVHRSQPYVATGHIIY